ncbi:MAG: ATP-dependent DNA helicase UvrD/PcrA, partial [uncultured Gemmatimonadetes bacterium]
AAPPALPPRPQSRAARGRAGHRGPRAHPGRRRLGQDAHAGLPHRPPAAHRRGPAQHPGRHLHQQGGAGDEGARGQDGGQGGQGRPPLHLPLAGRAAAARPRHPHRPSQGLRHLPHRRPGAARQAHHLGRGARGGHGRGRLLRCQEGALPDRRLEEPHGGPRRRRAGGGVGADARQPHGRLRRARRGRLPALRGLAARRRRLRLRRPPAAAGEAAARRRRGAREVLAALAVPDDRRVPGHQRGAAGDGAAPQRPAQEPVRGGRRRPVHLCLARRRRAQHPGLRAPVPGVQSGGDGGELPLHAAHPGRGQRRHRAQHHPPRKAPAHGERAGPQGGSVGVRGQRPALRRRAGGGDGGARDRRAALARAAPVERLRRPLPHQPAGQAGGRNAARRQHPLPGDRRAELLRPQGGGGRGGLPARHHQPGGRGLVAPHRQLPHPRHRAHHPDEAGGRFARGRPPPLGDDAPGGGGGWREPRPARARAALRGDDRGAAGGVPRHGGRHRRGPGGGAHPDGLREGSREAPAPGRGRARRQRQERARRRGARGHPARLRGLHRDLRGAHLDGAAPPGRGGRLESARAARVPGAHLPLRGRRPQGQGGRRSGPRDADEHARGQGAGVHPRLHHRPGGRHPPAFTQRAGGGGRERHRPHRRGAPPLLRGDHPRAPPPHPVRLRHPPPARRLHPPPALPLPQGDPGGAGGAPLRPVPHLPRPRGSKGDEGKLLCADEGDAGPAV